MARNLPTVTAHIVLNSRTLRIGHQAYQLRNIARVQTVALERLRKPRKAVWVTGIALIIVCGIIAAITRAHTDISVFIVVTLVAVVAISIDNLFGRLLPPLYALLLETTGYPQTVLTSLDGPELSRLSDMIVDAIENPPTSERSFYLNVVQGDQISQTGGHHNTIRR